MAVRFLLGIIVFLKPGCGVYHDRVLAFLIRYFAADSDVLCFEGNIPGKHRQLVDVLDARGIDRLFPADIYKYMSRFRFALQRLRRWALHADHGAAVLYVHRHYIMAYRRHRLLYQRQYQIIAFKELFVVPVHMVGKFAVRIRLHTAVEVEYLFIGGIVLLQFRYGANNGC